MKLKKITALSLCVVAFGAILPTASINAEGMFELYPLVLVATPTHHGVGMVKKIDKKGRKVELNHGPIKSIGWMDMTMFFDVDDSHFLDEIEVGDKIDFDFIETRDKRFVITDMEVQ